VTEEKTKWLIIAGFNLIDYIGHKKHGLATFFNTQHDKKLVKRVDCKKYSIGINIGELTIYNVFEFPFN